MQVQIVEHHKMLEGIPEADLPADIADFWRWVAYELRNLLTYGKEAQEPQLVLQPYRKAGTQYIWEFFVNDLAKPKAEEYNHHLQNTSQWRYAGCILLQNGRVSGHH